MFLENATDLKKTRTGTDLFMTAFSQTFGTGAGDRRKLPVKEMATAILLPK